MKPQLLNSARHIEPWHPETVATHTKKPEAIQQQASAHSLNRPLDSHAERSLSRRLHRKQAAIYLGTSLSWLDKTRLKGDGPVYLQIGGRVVYDIADLDEYMARCRRQSTSEQR